MKFLFSPLDILSSKTKREIVKFLITHEASMSEREIASILKVSHMNINRTMRELSEINLVDFITVGKAHLWRVNRKSYAFKILSRLIEEFSHITSPLDDLEKTILSHIPANLVEQVILFGSIGNGEETSASDIDVFVLVKDAEGKKKLEPSLEQLSNVCLEVYGNRLSPYVLSEHETKDKRKENLLAEIRKGIKIFPPDKDKT